MDQELLMGEPVMMGRGTLLDNSYGSGTGSRSPIDRATGQKLDMTVGAVIDNSRNMGNETV
jgi:hypothetical protein